MEAEVGKALAAQGLSSLVYSVVRITGNMSALFLRATESQCGEGGR